MTEDTPGKTALGFIMLFIITAGIVWYNIPTNYDIMLHNRQFRCERSAGNSYCGDNKIGSFRIWIHDKFNPKGKMILRIR